MTLIEILIVMVLIGVGLGTLAFPLSKAVKKEKFNKALSQVITEITLAQELMLDLRTDVELILEHENQTVNCKITPLAKLPKNLEASINAYHTIEGIDEMAFEGEVKSRIELHFEGKVGTVTQGALKLKSGDLEKTIHLQGYPKDIKRDTSVQKIQQATYPEEILSLI